MASRPLFAASPPNLAIEIARGRVCVAGLSRSGGSATVSAFATEPVPDTAVVPGPTDTNITDVPAVADALRQALGRAGLKSAGRAALIVPDSVARVSLLTFEELPAKAADLDQLVRWQLKKAMPFPIDDAQVTHFPAHQADGQSTVVAVAARRDVILEYEAVASAAGIRAGIVDLASFNVMNAVIGGGAAAPTDWLVVHLAWDATTLAILRGEDLMFYRHRLAVDEEPLSALIHQTAMYHEDRLGGREFTRVWLSGAGARGAEAMTQTAAEVTALLGPQVEIVDIRPAASLRLREEASPDVLDSLAAPVGMLLREQATR